MRCSFVLALIPLVACATPAQTVRAVAGVNAVVTVVGAVGAGVSVGSVQGVDKGPLVASLVVGSVVSLAVSGILFGAAGEMDRMTSERCGPSRAVPEFRSTSSPRFVPPKELRELARPVEEPPPPTTTSTPAVPLRRPLRR